MNNFAIEIEDLTVRLGDHTALDALDLCAPEGAFLTVIGPNGSGKTTLFRVLLGLIRPERGRVRVLGREPGEAPPAWIGYVPQVKTLNRRFPAQSLELVVTGLRGAWPARIRRAERRTALEALEAVGASHLARRLLGHLSGGELQRVYLARAIARRPRLILLDEPATGMDRPAETDMYEILERYQRESGATVVMITHDWGTSFHHASHVLVIDRREISFGPPGEALGEEFMREAFGHVGHEHAMRMEGWRERRARDNREHEEHGHD